MRRSTPVVPAASEAAKVPATITAIFWVTKLLTTAAGETISDGMVHAMAPVIAVTIGFVALLATMALQFRSPRYVPWTYWLAATMVSVFGTMAADVTHVALGVPYVVSTLTFAVVLALVFLVWNRREGTLSIHSIVTTGREAFYWVAILLTFALGTSVGDQVSEQFDLGYLTALWIFAAIIGAIVILHFAFHLNAILSFWLAYIMTRPLGASIGDWLSQSKDDGGLGLGTTNTSLIFLALILALVVYLTISKADRTPPDAT